MSTVQEIEQAIIRLPLAERVRLFHDLPHLLDRDREELDWQRLSLERFFQDDDPEDAVYDQL